MISFYLRIAFVIIGLLAAVVLALFAFTTAAIVVLVALIVAAVFGKKKPGVWVISREKWNVHRDHPKVIDHDPNDLPPDRR
ncbi:MAG: hypothetical protein FJX59_01930 [Alphaproteobacteria bacterium]|nr:hypothetical protein [Alphaproteobacteria bacterium]